MESILELVCIHAHDAHWIMFIMLLLAGMNIPISEDFILLAGGIIASTCIPEHTFHLYAWILAGCWISGWEAYWIGRLFGPKLYDIPWFRHFLTPKRITKLHHYYEKFGIFTFIVGRFIPGGVRNALFMTSGLGKMPFLKFMARDCLACIISSSTLFSIGYQFGEHHDLLLKYLRRYEIFFGLFLFTLICTLLYLFRRKSAA